jgi:serine protein kinase
MAYLMSMFRKNEKVAWRSYEPLKEAVENKLMASVKDLSRIVTKAKIRDKEQQQKYNVMVAKMIENGYCEHCAESLLKYAANNLWTTE